MQKKMESIQGKSWEHSMGIECFQENQSNILKQKKSSQNVERRESRAQHINSENYLQLLNYDVIDFIVILIS